MKLDKAIKIKEQAYEKYCVGWLLEEREADRLSIEALKAIGQWNHYQMPQHQFHLSGETITGGDNETR